MEVEEKLQSGRASGSRLKSMRSFFGHTDNVVEQRSFDLFVNVAMPQVVEETAEWVQQRTVAQIVNAFGAGAAAPF